MEPSGFWMATVNTVFTNSHFFDKWAVQGPVVTRPPELTDPKSPELGIRPSQIL